MKIPEPVADKAAGSFCALREAENVPERKRMPPLLRLIR